MVKNKISNCRGAANIIWVLIISLIFTMITLLIVDLFNVYLHNKVVKDAVSLAVKAACLQIKDGNELAEGRFLIDENKAIEAFKNVLCDNLNLDNKLQPLETSFLCEKPVIKEINIINEFNIEFHSSSLNQNYYVENPSIFAVVEFKTKTLFINGNITVDKLSSSQLCTIFY